MFKRMKIEIGHNTTNIHTYTYTHTHELTRTSNMIKPFNNIKQKKILNENYEINHIYLQ